jgi:hypothetical protein
MRTSHSTQLSAETRARAAAIADGLDPELSLSLAFLEDLPKDAASEVLWDQRLGTRSLYRGLGVLDADSGDQVTPLGAAVIASCAERHNLGAGTGSSARPLRAQLLGARIRPNEPH